MPDRQLVRPDRRAGRLPRQRVIIRRESSGVQGVTQMDHPGLVDGVEDAAVDPRPVVDWHAFLLDAGASVRFGVRRSFAENTRYFLWATPSRMTAFPPSP